MGTTSSTESAQTVLERTVVASTRWLSLVTLTYRDAKGESRKWDLVSRTTKRSPTAADAVAIFVKLRGAGKEASTMLVRQFRPPVNAYTLELPAGLIDEGETPAQAALRELLEETGYTGTVDDVSPALAMSPGLTDETIHLVQVSVDLDAAVNANPKQALEDTEDIEVSMVSLRDLKQTLTNHAEGGGVVFAALWWLAMDAK